MDTVEISKPTGATVWAAYQELFLAVQNGIGFERNDPLKKTFEDVSELIEHEHQEQAELEPYREAAREQSVDSDVDIDGSAIVSKGEDDGAYVECWIWVSNSDL